MEEFSLAQAPQNGWYYSQANRDVGPFQLEVLSTLARAQVIDDATPVRKANETEWHPLATVLPKDVATASAPFQNETRYYYLNTADQPVGPFNVATLQRLHGEKVIGVDTLVSGVGDPDWIPATRLLKLPPPSPSLAWVQRSGTPDDIHPRYLPFERYVLMMTVTLGFYPFYLVPCQSRDLKAITGRERMEFTALLILSIVTLGLVLLIMQVLWAYDLERHGKAINKAGRKESLGTLVLGATALGFFACLAIDGFFLSTLVCSLFNGVGLWLVQREINLYAATPAVAIP